MIALLFALIAQGPDAGVAPPPAAPAAPAQWRLLVASDVSTTSPGVPAVGIAFAINSGLGRRQCIEDFTNGPMELTITLSLRGNGSVASVDAEHAEARAPCLERALSSIKYPTSSAPMQTATVRLRANNEPVLMGSMDKETIRNVVRSYAEQVRGCYERALTSSPALAGKVKMHWVIDGDARIIEVSVVEQPPGFDAVSSCLQQAIATWTFPKPKGGGKVMVTYPFVFRTSERRP